MPDWVQFTGEDVAMIAFACAYVLAGTGMYVAFLRNKSSHKAKRSDMLYFLTRRLAKRSRPVTGPRWSLRSA